MKTETVMKLNEAKELLKTAHETLTDAIVNDPAFAAFAMKNPKNREVEIFITALLKTNSAGRDLQNLIALHG